MATKRIGVGSPKYPCPATGCEKTFSDIQQRDQHQKDTGHMASSVLHKHKCHGCSKTFPDVLQRDQHERDIGHAKTLNKSNASVKGDRGDEVQMKVVQCRGKGCQRKFLNTEQRNQHEIDSNHRPVSTMPKEETSGLTFKCKGCPKKFPSKQIRDQHETDSGHDKRLAPAPQAAPRAVPTYNVNHAARLFHDVHARRGNATTSSSSEAFYQITDQIAEALKKQNLITKRDYVGSTWEGTSIDGISDYDVLLIIQDNTIKVDTKHTAPPGHDYLIHSQDEQPFKSNLKHGQMKGHVQKIINGLNPGAHTVKMGQQGPAITLEIFEDKLCKKMVCSVDLVPTMELVGGKQYVCPPIHRATDSYWKKSHSLEAKVKLKTADTGDGIRREVFRVCKVVRKREATLATITSYELKCSLFKVMDQIPNGTMWKRDKLGERSLDVLREVSKAYRCRKLNDYYEQRINLISRVSDQTADNIANRLDKLIKNPREIFGNDKVPTSVI